jgi:excisionase family DNA binding protein
LAISRRTLFDLTKAGRLPSVKIGRHNRYRRSDVEQIMRNGLAA